MVSVEAMSEAASTPVPPTILAETMADVRETDHEWVSRLDEMGNSKCGAVVGFHQVTGGQQHFFTSDK